MCFCCFLWFFFHFVPISKTKIWILTSSGLPDVQNTIRKIEVWRHILRHFRPCGKFRWPLVNIWQELKILPGDGRRDGAISRCLSCSTLRTSFDFLRWNEFGRGDSRGVGGRRCRRQNRGLRQFKDETCNLDYSFKANQERRSQKFRPNIVWTSSSSFLPFFFLCPIIVG